MKVLVYCIYEDGSNWEYYIKRHYELTVSKVKHITLSDTIILEYE